jgi:hypothetical protein
MTKPSDQDEIVLAIFLVSLLFSLLLLSRKQDKTANQDSAYSRDSTVEPKSDARDNPSRYEYRQFYETIKRGFLWFIFYRVGHDVFNSFSTIILAIATSALALIALWQWSALNSSDIAIHESARAATDAAKAAKDSVRLTRDAMRLDQRAWIGIETMDAIPPIPTIGSKFEVTIRVTGKTPARNLISVGRDDTIPISARPIFSYDGIAEDHAGTLAPNAVAPIPINPMKDTTTGKDHIFSMSYISLLQLELTRIYVSGIITYDDIFSKPHWVTYCAWLRVPFDGQFNRCNSHNDTDDYTEQQE